MFNRRGMAMRNSMARPMARRAPVAFTPAQPQMKRVMMDLDPPYRVAPSRRGRPMRRDRGRGRPMRRPMGRPMGRPMMRGRGRGMQRPRNSVRVGRFR